MRLAPLLPKHRAQFIQVTALTSEAERDKIHADLHADGDIVEIFFCQRGQIDAHTRKIDVASGAERTRGHDSATNTIIFFVDDEQLNNAVVDKHGVPFLDIVDEPIVVDFNRVGLAAFRPPDSKLENIPRF